MKKELILYHITLAFIGDYFAKVKKIKEERKRFA